jgi:hypothetical protein
VSGHKARITTLQALVAGAPAVSSAAKVINELAEVHFVRKVRNDRRRRLLEIVHSVRALDTTLRDFVTHHKCIPKGQSQIPKSLGGYLFALRQHNNSSLGQITEAQRQHFQQSIVSKRNTYMHEAAMFPVNDQVANVLLADMQFCLATVLAL